MALVLALLALVALSVHLLLQEIQIPLQQPQTQPTPSINKKIEIAPTFIFEAIDIIDISIYQLLPGQQSIYILLFCVLLDCTISRNIFYSAHSEWIKCALFRKCQINFDNCMLYQ